jgi:hypothetical protein
MAERKFNRGDPVRNTNDSSVYYDRIKDKIGVYQRAWDERYTLRRACDVRYSGVSDLYGREDIAQSEDDLELVPISRPENEMDPFHWVVNGKLMRVQASWQTCGHKEKRSTRYNRCLQCYPPSGKIYASHGPYYYGSYRDASTGKHRRVYIGRELPPQDGRKEGEA